jgi:hypothetical protein
MTLNLRTLSGAELLKSKQEGHSLTGKKEDEGRKHQGHQVLSRHGLSRCMNATEGHWWRQQSTVIIFSFMVLEFELRALCLLGRCPSA